MNFGGLGFPASKFATTFGGLGPGFAGFGGFPFAKPFGFPFAKPFGFPFAKPFAFPFAKPSGFPFAKPFGFAGFPGSAFGTAGAVVPSALVATTPI